MSSQSSQQSVRNRGVSGVIWALAAAGWAGASGLAHAQYTATRDVLGVTISEAGSADSMEAATKIDNRWTLRLEPAAWYAGLGGKFATPRSTGGTNSQVRFIDLKADNPILTPTGEARLRWNDWLFSLRGFVFSRKADGTGLAAQVGDVAFSASDQTKLKYDMTSVDLEVGYRVLSHRDAVLKSSEPSLRVDVDVIGGGRLMDAKVDFSVPTLSGPNTSLSKDDVFFQPYLGARLEFEIYEQTGFDVQITGGYLPGGSESTTFDIIAGFWWEPVNHVMVQVGYRSFIFDYKSGDKPNDFSASASLQGLYFGAVVRF